MSKRLWKCSVENVLNNFGNSICVEEYVSMSRLRDCHNMPGPHDVCKRNQCWVSLRHYLVDLSNISASEKAFSSLRVDEARKWRCGTVHCGWVARREARATELCDGNGIRCNVFHPQERRHGRLFAEHVPQYVAIKSLWTKMERHYLDLFGGQHRQPLAVWKTHKYCTKIDIHGEPTLQSKNNLG